MFCNVLGFVPMAQSFSYVVNVENPHAMVNAKIRHSVGANLDTSNLEQRQTFWFHRLRMCISFWQFPPI